MSKTTGRQYPPKFKMRVALEVIKGDKTLSQVASENNIQPSLASLWRDQLLNEGAEDVFGKSKKESERKKQEKAAQKEKDELLKTIGQLTVERDFLQRFCDEYGYEPPEAPGSGRHAG
ncbi:transposase [Parafannyhessea umbonata]|uniref:Transposase n=1 Tax=Parafannyhessea umbonata TaxID=604330 RepID=A0A1G6NMB3_9ACTN|nr:transposase [Parafannyhessea umbonata]SDC68868.1 Transposase [Parafannyhessea umbonata]